MDNLNLSDREIEALKLLGQGKSNKEIAQELFISINTVKVHVNNIFKKLGVSSRTEATLYAIEHELIDNPRPDAEPVHIYVPVPDSGERAHPEPTWFSKYWWAFAALAIALVIGLSLLLSTSALFAEPTPTNNPLINTLHQERWRALNSILTARSDMGVTVWDEAIYTIGGRTTEGASSTVERYVHANNSWETLEFKPNAVFDIGAVTVGGKIYVPGGILSDGSLSSMMEVYDPRTNSWDTANDLPAAVSDYGITAFEGSIYLFGGWDGEKDLANVWVYTPNTDQWREASPMPIARSGMSIVPLGDDIFIFGGECEQIPCLQSFVYSPSLENSNESAWKEQITLDEGIDFIGAQAVSGSLFLFGKTGDGAVQIKNYTPQNNMWYTYSEESDESPSNDSQLVSLGSNVYFLGGTTADANPSEKLIRYQAVFTIVLPQIGN